MTAWTFRKKKTTTKPCLFRRYFLFTLTQITEKELERRKKNMEIQSGGEKMKNASGQQGENKRQ